MASAPQVGVTSKWFGMRIGFLNGFVLLMLIPSNRRDFIVYDLLEMRHFLLKEGTLRDSA